MTTRITLVPGANRFAEDKEEARRLRLSRILPALEHQDKVVLDFREVSHATQSYVHALIGASCRLHTRRVSRAEGHLAELADRWGLAPEGSCVSTSWPGSRARSLSSPAATRASGGPLP